MGICPFTQCGLAHGSERISRIFAGRSSEEFATPAAVQRLCDSSFEPHGLAHGTERISLKSLDGLFPFEVLCYCLNL